MSIQWHDILGSIGVALIIVTYFLLQLERLSSSGLLYSILNALGAFFVIISLMYEFNLPAFIVEAFWVLISVFGITKYFLSKKKQ
ncbi:MAG: CBU_0592 family membrane protein [Gammaproteobacteria bacterium]